MKIANWKNPFSAAAAVVVDDWSELLTSITNIHLLRREHRVWGNRKPQTKQTFIKCVCDSKKAHQPSVLTQPLFAFDALSVLFSFESENGAQTSYIFRFRTTKWLIAYLMSKNFHHFPEAMCRFIAWMRHSRRRRTFQCGAHGAIVENCVKLRIPSIINWLMRLDRLLNSNKSYTPMQRNEWMNETLMDFHRISIPLHSAFSLFSIDTNKIDVCWFFMCVVWSLIFTRANNFHSYFTHLQLIRFSIWLFCCRQHKIRI